jgi:hypothetical protein
MMYNYLIIIFALQMTRRERSQAVLYSKGFWDGAICGCGIL